MSEALPLFDGTPIVDHPWPITSPAHPKRKRENWTWPKLCQAEPELRFLETNCRMQSTLPIDHLWEHHKRRLKQLCGWGARSPDLKSNEAFDCAYSHLRNVFEQTH